MEQALLAAVKSGDLAAVRSLLGKGADLNVRDVLGWSPLMWASAMGLTHIVRVLLENGADTEAGDDYGATALMKACRQGNAGVVDLLLKYGADVDAVDRDWLDCLDESRASRPRCSCEASVGTESSDRNCGSQRGHSPYSGCIPKVIRWL